VDELQVRPTPTDVWLHRGDGDAPVQRPLDHHEFGTEGQELLAIGGFDCESHLPPPRWLEHVQRSYGGLEIGEQSVAVRAGLFQPPEQPCRVDPWGQLALDRAFESSAGESGQDRKLARAVT
jgi:hypothetical protein